MTHSILRFVAAETCESILRDVNAFIEASYHEANARARRAHVYEYGTDMEACAFPIHCPGSPETDALPGFGLSELPPALAELSERAALALRLERGRILFNVGRYPEHADALNPHWDGELFDFTVTPGQGNLVRSGIRPSEVALLTLRNETDGGTTLHDEEGKVTQTHAQPGELLIFDNTRYKHGVSAAGAFPTPPPPDEPPRWIRYTIGWRALEEGHHWVDGKPLRPIDFAEAVAMHETFLREDWPSQCAQDLARARFPFPTRHV